MRRLLAFLGSLALVNAWDWTDKDDACYPSLTTESEVEKFWDRMIGGTWVDAAVGGKRHWVTPHPDGISSDMLL